MRAPLRLLLLLDAMAVAFLTAALVIALGVPLQARRELTLTSLLVVSACAALLAAIVGVVLLWRAVAGPVDRMLAAARWLGRPGDLPLLGEGDGLGLSRASVLFARLAAELHDERSRLTAKVEELARTNATLAEAREHLIHSERLATTGRLAAGLAHEVGNPLGAITGYAELARARLPPGADPELRGALERIAAAAGRIDGTVRDLQDFARPTPPVLNAVSVGPIVEAVLELARVQPRLRSVEVGVAIPADLPAVRGDPNRLAQVLLNLVLNGADAMKGRGRLKIAARVGAEGQQGMVAIVVGDEGPGIPPEHLERIFDPFFTTKERGEGSGLGLAVSRQIVESFGGRLHAANRAGGGAELTVLLRTMGERASG